MKETKLAKDQYNVVKLKDMKPNEYVKVTLHKYNKATVRDVTWTGGTFKDYSINCKHNGEECYLKLTPSLAKRMEDFPVGTSIRIMAMADARLKGGKSYIVLEEEVPQASPLSKELEKAFKDSAEFINSLDKKYYDIPDDDIILTFTQDPYQFEEDEQSLLGQFKRYCIDNGY